MTDTEQIQEQYRRMYDAMIRKDASGLDAVLDDSFVLIHMTGMRQPKPVFIQSVLDGTLNYFDLCGWLAKDETGVYNQIRTNSRKNPDLHTGYGK